MSEQKENIVSQFFLRVFFKSSFFLSYNINIDYTFIMRNRKNVIFSSRPTSLLLFHIFWF